MYLERIRIKNFRNLDDEDIAFPRGIAIIVGRNGAGKSSMLEAAQYALCGRSFRTSRDAEMVAKGEEFFRLQMEGENEGVMFQRTVSLAAGEPVRIDAGGGPRWLPPAAVVCFTPDHLQLVKGAPALRRRFIDEQICRRTPAYRQTMLAYQRVLSQRNSFLQRVKAGRVQLAEISPWDRQLAALAHEVYLARSEYCDAADPHFAASYSAIAGANAGGILSYRSPLSEAMTADDPEAATLAKLKESWAADLERLSSGYGAHRDDFDFLLGSRCLRSYGSQGEQRAAALALLLASRSLAREEGGAPPLVLLDDVMSELDPPRRRRLMDTLGDCGQVIITAADRSLFTAEEMEQAAVFKAEGGFITEEHAIHV